MYISATELNKHSGRTLDRAIKEPVIIEKSGQPFVAIIAYERFVELEDAYWGNLAAQDTEFAAKEESMTFLMNKSDV